jgi:hypothetical protein
VGLWVYGSGSISLLTAPKMQLNVCSSNKVNPTSRVLLPYSNLLDVPAATGPSGTVLHRSAELGSCESNH